MRENTRRDSSINTNRTDSSNVQPGQEKSKEKKMKKRIAMIAAAFTLTFAGVSASGITASAAMAASDQVDEQYVVEEDGQTVVYLITYTEPDDVIHRQTVSWYDMNGTKFVRIYKTRPQEEKRSEEKRSGQDPLDISSTVTWEDAAGNTYVLNNNTQTVTVYDVDGNVIAVMPA